jgi:multiple sugar transport system substrate-binding protein
MKGNLRFPLFVPLLVVVVLIGTLAAQCAAPAATPTVAPPPAATPTPPPAAPAATPTPPPAAPAAGAPADAETKQADMTNLFPNGIGNVDCKGVKLVVGTQTGPQIASPVENFWKQWGDKTGGTVEVQTFPFGDLFEKIRAGYVSGASPFDIIIYASDWAGDIIGPGYVLEVPQKVQDQVGYGYLIPTYRDRILSWGGKVYGVPYDGDDHITYYRKDLLTDPKNQADFKAKYGYDLPVPIKTWPQYRDIAEFFNNKTIGGQTIYGAGTAFKRGGQSYWTFLGVAAAFAKAPGDPSYFFDADTMEPRINNPGFVEALNYYVSLSKVGPPEVVNWDVGDIRSAFPAGKLALAIDWGDVGPLAADKKSSVVTDGWSAQMHPGVDKYYDAQAKQWVEKYNRAPYLAFGGWIQSVSKTTKNPECAFDFAAFMGNQNMGLLLSVTPATGVNPHFFSDVNNLDPWVKMGMSETQAKEYLAAVRDTINDPNAVVDLRITGAAEYFDALDTQLARAVAGEVTAQQALDEVAKGWNAITDRLGRDQQKKLYRQMLGLPTQ